MSSTPSPDNFFGRYRKVRELGRGGMGLVVLADDSVLNVQVALKLVPDVVINDSEGIADLKKEVLRGMELTHPNIVRVFSFEQDETAAVIVMEHVQGETLSQKKMQKPERCFDCDEVRPWLEQLCAALDYAHQEARIAHRDLKPSNLMLTPAGRLKVADFGIASSLSDTMSRVSVRKDSSGTPPYMSPQQAMGERPTHLDDIYSLGATVYELLTGKPPFFRGNVLAQVLQEEPMRMAERRAELGVKAGTLIPEEWERMVAACLSKNPDVRPKSGAAVLAMLAGSAPVVTASKPKMEAPVMPRPDLLPKVSRPAVPVAPSEPVTKFRPHKPGMFAGLAGAVGSVARLVMIAGLLAGVAWGAWILKQRSDAQKPPEVVSAPAPTPSAPTPKPTPAPTMLDRGGKPGLHGAGGLDAPTPTRR